MALIFVIALIVLGALPALPLCARRDGTKVFTKEFWSA